MDAEEKEKAQLKESLERVKHQRSGMQTVIFKLEDKVDLLERQIKDMIEFIRETL